MPAVAYLRRSRVDTRRPGDISHEGQIAAIRALAERHGDDPDALVIVEDWGRSGRAEKQHLRTGFARIEEMVRSGDATAIYAYSANRLARSLEALARLAKACEAAGVPIRCADGYSPDVSTSTGRMVLGILGSVYAWQAEWTAERAAETTSVRRARGDHMGPAPYGFRVVGGQLVENDGEDFDAVLAAYQSEGTIQGTVRRLTADGVPTRAGGPWQASTVLGMLRRRAPDVLPRRMERGRPATRQYLLAGLLRCSCGATLTGTVTAHRKDWVSYRCKRVALAPNHPGQHSIGESRLMQWVREEAARLRTPGAIETGEPDEADRAGDLQARRERVVEAFLDGHIDRARRDAELASIDADLDKLDRTGAVVPVPAIDWTWPTAKLNAVLRSLWDYVELDEQMQPVRAEWNVPEWRA